MITKSTCIFIFIFFVTLAGGNAHAQAGLSLRKTNTGVEMSNGAVMARFSADGQNITQRFYAKKDGRWVLVVRSFDIPEHYPQNAVQLFNYKLDSAHRFFMSSAFRQIETVRDEQDSICVRLNGTRNGNSFEQLVTLRKGQKNFSIRVSTHLAGPPYQVDYALSSFAFNINKLPGFVHTPGVKFDNRDSKQNRFKLLPGRDQIIGDRAFHAPAVILQEGNLFAALVPDLNVINQTAVISTDARRTIDIPRNQFSVPVIPEKYTMPTGLDLNVKTGLTVNPVFSYGLMDNIIAHHIRYQRTNGPEMTRSVESGDLVYGFDLFVSATEVKNRGYEQIPAFQWKNYGHRVFVNHPHLVMPFRGYLNVVDSITLHPSKTKDIDIPLKGYEDHGSWLEFDLNGLPAGGYRSAINFWNDVIHNSIFWNNARDASGFWFWGNHLGRSDLIEKAHRIINFCLSAPQNQHGLFATLYNANSKTWGLQFSDPPAGKNELFLRQSSSYDVAAMSKTAAHLLDYYSRCEKDRRIVGYLRPYANWLVGAIDKDGTVPSYETTSMEASPLLRRSAQSAASMWFLSSMYLVTHEIKYKLAAEKIAAFLAKEVLPDQNWIDMEQYYSCGAKPLAFQRDVWQNEPLRGNLSTIWAAEGFARLYEATHADKYLRLGTACIEYLSFSQCSWSPGFIYTAFPFGGFTADNSDNSTMLDARQAETVKPFIWYGKMLNRQDLMERGVAAARASVTLMNLPEHKANDIYSHPNIYPYGLGPENIDHEGHPQSAMRTSPSWGEGSGVFTGLAEAYRGLSGGYIDFKHNVHIGADGITIESAELRGNKVQLRIKSMLSGLKMPYAMPFVVDVALSGLKSGSYTVFLNGRNYGAISGNRLTQIRLLVEVNGVTSMVNN